jgi:hypothetical protein
MWQCSDGYRRWDASTSIESLKDSQDEWIFAPGHLKQGATQIAAIQSAFSSGLVDLSKTFQGANAEKARLAADGVFKNAVLVLFLI